MKSIDPTLVDTKFFQRVVRTLCLSFGVLIAFYTTSDFGASSFAAESNSNYVDDARIINSFENEPGNWLSYGQNYKEQRFSHLTQITPDNADRMGLAWSTTIGDYNMRMSGTPLVIDGVMYVSNGWSVVYALDATNGEEIWRYDPEVDRSYIRLACCGPAHNRGVAAYQGKVYVATFDGRLLAIDATTGEKVWELPLTNEYKKLIKSDIADIKNIGGRGAGTITAAAFLSYFVDDYPWAHLDIAGTAWTQEGTPKKSYIKKGATGVGVLLSIDFLRNL